MKITLTYVNRSQKTAKSGKPYTSLSIKAQEYGDRFINGFGNADNKDWSVGQSVEANITEKEYNGKKYLNFETPKKEDKLASELNSFGLKLGVLNSKLDKILEALKIPTKANPYAGFSQNLQDQIKKDEERVKEVAEDVGDAEDIASETDF